jgi:hypothetical protein
MRRGFGVYLVLGLGIFLLVLAPMLRFFLLPQVAKLPLDPYTVSELTANGATYIDQSTGNIVTGADLTAWNETRGDVGSGTGDRMVWEGKTTIVASDGQSLPKLAANGKDVEGLVNDINRSRVPMDRKTAAALDCCEVSPPGRDRSLSFNWPMNTEKKTYRWFDETPGKPFPMEFVRESERNGVTVYEFSGIVPPTKVESREVPGSVVGRPQVRTLQVDQFYENLERKAWVEPTTGAIIDSGSHPRVTLRDQLTGETLATVFEAQLRMVRTIPEPVRAEAGTQTANPQLAEALMGSDDLLKRAKDGAAKLRLIGTTIPLVALILGLLLVAVAVVLLLRRSGGGRRPTGQHRVRAPEPDDADKSKSPVSA